MKIFLTLVFVGSFALRAAAITATTFSPTPDASGACVDALLTVTFDVVPKVGTTGRIRILQAATDAVVETIDLGSVTQTRLIGTNTTPYNYLPIIVSGQTATIFPRAGVLGYGQTYYVTIEPTVFSDAASGAAFAGIADNATFRFATRAAGPAAGARALTVAADGSGDFCTVQGAIDFVPRNPTASTVINVRRGTYREIVYIGSAKPFITLRGEDRAQTILTYANNANFNNGNNRTMVACDANEFRLENITLRNATPKGGSQAEAIRGNGQRCIFDRVTLASFQDTLLWNGSLFVTDSLIEGDVDFMWGGGACFFQRCELRALGAGFYAQVRNSQTGKGNVYVDCRLTSAPGVTNSVLARIDPRAGVANTWPYSQVVFVNCAMGAHITAAGWQLDGATTAPDLQFWEYQSTDLAGNALDVSRRHPASRQIDDGTAARYRDASFVLGFAPALSVTAPSPRAERLTGLSTRARATGGDGVVIVGFVVSGSADRRVLARAVGPLLAAFGVGDVLPAPRLELFRAGAMAGLAVNAGWTTAPDPVAVTAAIRETGLFALSAASADSAIVQTLPPGGYTAVLNDVGGRAGNGLVEIYDLAPTDGGARLANLSSRAFVGAGEATLIAGMTIRGSSGTTKPLLIRAIGPTLGRFGLAGALTRAQLTLFDARGAVIAANANWTASASALEIARVSELVGAFPLTTGSADSALLVDLAPGNYTAQVTGRDGEAGVALVEVYEVP
jgi:pectin methylesterase-like acyl-CoA thioesterase